MASEENRDAMPLAGKRADGSDQCDSEKDTDDELPANAEEVQDPGSHEGPQPPRRIPYEERLHLILKDVHTNIALASSYFMETVEEVFDVLHRGMRQEFQRYDHKLFDPTIEEEIPVEEMDRLCLFAEAVQPNWGENMKQWIKCDKVVTVCNYNDHWGTVLLDLKR
ncbi:hypothetical protein OROMI_032205 [Orobanche minor]